jgi:oligoribonuclease NrnB/cAMP/cGMP phosphodiesterase (DHH superfamily)
MNTSLPEETEVYIITHGYCHDGAASAWIIDSYFKQKMARENKVYNITHYRISPSYAERFIKGQEQFHSTESNKVKSKRIIYSSDLAFSGTDMEKLIRLYPQIIIIDHHISSYRSVLSHYYSQYLSNHGDIDMNGKLIDTDTKTQTLDYLSKLTGNLPNNSELLSYLPSCYKFDNNESGATLTFKYLYGDSKDVEPPMLVKYIRDRDLWKFELPNSFAVTLGIYEMLSNMPLNNDWKQWDDFIANEKESLVEAEKIGTLISNLTNRRVKELAYKTAPLEIKMNGVTYLGGHVNTTEHISDLGNYIVNIKAQNNTEREYVYDFALIWQFDTLEHVFSCSLRSRSKPSQEGGNPSFSCEVDKIATCFGGGGHSAAAGFRINNLFEMLNKPISSNSIQITEQLQKMVKSNIPDTVDNTQTKTIY